MTITVEWQDIVVRLALSFVSGVVFGINRTERGRTAGLVTTVLVSLAAAVAMIQTNLLLPVSGKSPESFATLDLMRLPLGILTGMGFIGAGVVLRRGERIRGITTAATLWLVTILGLCFGGGQLVLGVTASVLGLLALAGLKHLELHLRQDRRSTLILSSEDADPTEEEVRAELRAAGCRIASWNMSYHKTEGKLHRTLLCEVEWRGGRNDLQPPTTLKHLTQRPTVQKLTWKS